MELANLLPVLRHAAVLFPVPAIMNEYYDQFKLGVTSLSAGESLGNHSK